MPFHENSIGGEQFDTMEGMISVVTPELEIFQRPGIDSIGARKLGDHSKPFELITVKYVLDFTAARDALFTYAALVGSNPVTVVKESVDYGFYLLLNVELAEDPVAVFNPIGTIIPDAQVRQTLRWTMQGG